MSEKPKSNLGITVESALHALASKKDGGIGEIDDPALNSRAIRMGIVIGEMVSLVRKLFL